MQDHVPLRSSYREWGYDALATTTSLSDFEQTEAEERSVSIGWQSHPDNYRKMSLLALCCCCPVGVKAFRQSLQVSMKLATYLSVFQYTCVSKPFKKEGVLDSKQQAT